VWSYAGNLNFSLMGCKKAVPDIELLADGLFGAMTRLQRSNTEEHESPGEIIREVKAPQ
jgi:hypothetical protein